MKRTTGRIASLAAAALLVASTLTLTAEAAGRQTGPRDGSGTRAGASAGQKTNGTATQKKAGPRDGTGNQGSGPKDGTGYGAGQGNGSGTCDSTGPKGNQNGGKKGGKN
jgi:hypothetical protein